MERRQVRAPFERARAYADRSLGGAATTRRCVGPREVFLFVLGSWLGATCYFLNAAHRSSRAAHDASAHATKLAHFHRSSNATRRVRRRPGPVRFAPLGARPDRRPAAPPPPPEPDAVAGAGPGPAVPPREDGLLAIVCASTLPPPVWPGATAEETVRDWRSLRSVLQAHFSSERRNEPIARYVGGAIKYRGDGPPVACARRFDEGCADGSDCGWRVREGCSLGIERAWRAMHATINAAYARAHGYDFYFASIADCPREYTWCQKMSVLALMEAPGARRYRWYAAIDEDCVFNDFSLSLPAFLESLKEPVRADRAEGRKDANPSRYDRRAMTLSAALASREGLAHTGALAADEGAVLAIVSKEVSGIKGINCGAMLFRSGAEGLLADWWRESPEASYYAFPREQGTFAAAVAADPRYADAVHVAPADELYGFGQRGSREDARYVFHNTRGNAACGRTRADTPDPNCADQMRIDCLAEHLFSEEALEALVRLEYAFGNRASAAAPFAVALASTSLGATGGAATLAFHERVAGPRAGAFSDALKAEAPEVFGRSPRPAREPPVAVDAGASAEGTIAQWEGRPRVRRGERPPRAVDPVVEHLLRSRAVDRAVVVCLNETGAPSLGAGHGAGVADASCARHLPGGGAWPEALRPYIDVVDVAALDARFAEALRFLLHTTERGARGYHKAAPLLAHVAAIADRADATGPILVVEGDSVAPEWSPLEKRLLGSNATKAAKLEARRRAAAAIARDLDARPWEVFGLCNSYVHALRPIKMHRVVMDGDVPAAAAAALNARLEAQKADCVGGAPCGCPAQCACARRSQPGAEIDLCDVPAAPGAPGRAVEATTGRCDVRDYCAYVVHPRAFPKFGAFLDDLLAEPDWVRNGNGMPPFGLPYIDLWLASHFDHVYALPLLARQSHKQNYHSGRGGKLNHPWHDVFRESCLRDA